jgi:EpsI family protein
MIARAAVVIVLLLGTAAYAARTTGAESVVDREGLALLPFDLGNWTGRDSTPFGDDIINQLGVDDHINRIYASPDAVPVGLYVGYYASQRQGDTIHSPQNCLPGAGWLPVESGYTTIDAGGTPRRINRYVIQKGLERQVVFYWYQGRGRVVANEYANKLGLMLDAARLHRTNGGLVRLIAPVTSTAERTTVELTRFTTLLFPHLSKHLP